MSESINTKNRHDLRWQLLTTVSALALIGNMCATQAVKASDDTDHPLVWIELGGQFDTESEPAQTWTPPNRPLPLVQPAFEPFGRMPGVGYDWDGKVSVQPNNSDWTFSAAIQFGKAKHGPKSTHDQDNPSGYNIFGSQPAPPTYAFTDSHSVSDTSHLILDFQVGKDLGLGLFGGHGSSNINFGVRLAQFTEDARGTMTAQVSAPLKYSAGVGRKADMHAARSFSGIGPSIGLNASLPLAGSMTNGIAFDWGANGAVLFGRQKANVLLHTKNAQYYHNNGYPGYTANPPKIFSQSTLPLRRNKNVLVPNIGGFAGLSWYLPSAKVSVGYRADFFFGARDGGIDTRKSENVGFYGPFASVSIGIGG